MKAYIYCRTSIEKDFNNNYQMDECIKYCNDNNIEIGGVFNHVISSRNMKNGPYLEKIINSMTEGDVLIVYSVCRFSRNMLGGLQILDLLEKKGLNIYSVDERLSYVDIFERRKFRDIMNESELETDRLSNRILQAKKSKKRKFTDDINNIFINDPLKKYNTYKKK